MSLAPISQQSSTRLGTPKADTGALPSVFAYRNYRTFLADWLAFKKRVQPTYSGAVFARKAGLASHTLLGMVTRGDRNLTHKTVRACARALELAGNQVPFFEALVLFNQADNSADQAYYLGQLTQAAPTGEGKESLRRLSDYSEYLSHWSHHVIREMVVLPGFRPDPIWLSKKLQRRITPQQADQAWTRLVNLGFVAEKDGRWVMTSSKLITEPHRPSLLVQEFHETYLQHAAASVRTQPMKEREFGWVTFAVPASEVEVIKEKVRNFWKELLDKFPASDAPREHVVVVSVQALQMTDSDAPESAESKNKKENLQ